MSEVLEGFFRSPLFIYGRTAPRSAGGTSSDFDSPAALLDSLFEHPASCSCAIIIRSITVNCEHELVFHSLLSRTGYSVLVRFCKGERLPGSSPNLLSRGLE